MPIKDITRFESAVRSLEAQPTTPGGVLLYGSSTFARFPAGLLARALAPLPVTNRGFGGSTAEEALYYYPRLVSPAFPRVLVWYEGDNDPHFDYTPDRVFCLSERVWRRARAEFPGLLLVLVGTKPAQGEPEANKARRTYNRRLAQYAKARDFAAYIDLSALVITADGKPRADCFQPDGVHLTDSAYETLARAICGAIKELTDGKL